MVKEKDFTSTFKYTPYSGFFNENFLAVGLSAEELVLSNSVAYHLIKIFLYMRGLMRLGGRHTVWMMYGGRVFYSHNVGSFH